MNKEIKPCRRCGGMPNIYSVDGLWYSHCPNCIRTRTATGMESIYKNLSLTESKAVDLWNEQNSKVISEAQKKAIEKQKARYAAMRKEKAAKEAALSPIKKRPDELPRIIGVERLKAKRL